MKRLHAVLLAAVIVFLACWGAVQAAALPDPGATHFDAEAATAAYLAQLSPEARAKSDAYFEGGYWLLLWDFVAAAVVAWLFLGTRLSTLNRLQQFVQRVRYRCIVKTASENRVNSIVRIRLSIFWISKRQIA